MTDSDYNASRRRCRRGGIAAGLGAAAGGILIAAFSQLAAAPSAHADAFTDVFSDLQASIDAANLDFSTAATDFAGGSTLDLLDGTANTLSGIDTDLFAPVEDAVVIGYDALTGNTEPGPYELGLGFIPADFNSAVEIAQGDIEGAQFDFSTAATDFASSDFADGLSYATDGFNLLAAQVPGDLLLGLDASLVNGAPDVVINGLLGF